MHELLSSISRFYHRWHALELVLGEKICVLDFDYCPREDLLDLEPPFADRLEALKHLEALRDRLASYDHSNLCNAEFLAQKLDGAAAFLRALMGEYMPLAVYLRATMGIAPEPISQDEIESMRAELEKCFSSLGIEFSPEGSEDFHQYIVMNNVSQFETKLRDEASRWVTLLQERIGLTAQPNYKIKIVSEDAYWANWVDGSIDTPILLRVNTHPRITFLTGCEAGFAVHEIGAHALQVLELDAARRVGRVDGAAMNLATHSCEQFQLEGLAQTVIYLVAERDEIPEALDIDLQLRAYHSALSNNAQIEIEAGRPIDEAIEQLLQQAPFLSRLKAISDLRDRGRHPLDRAYTHVYAPSRRKFLSAKMLPKAQRMKFLHRMYTQLWTPNQIDYELKTLVASTI